MSDVGVWEFDVRVRVRGYGERETIQDQIRELIAGAVQYRFSTTAVEFVSDGDLVHADRVFVDEPQACPDVAGKDVLSSLRSRSASPTTSPGTSPGRPD